MTDDESTIVTSNIDIQPSDLPIASISIILPSLDPDLDMDVEYDPEKQIIRVPQDIPTDGKSVRYVPDSIVDLFDLPSEK